MIGEFVGARVDGKTTRALRMAVSSGCEGSGFQRRNEVLNYANLSNSWRCSSRGRSAAPMRMQSALAVDRDPVQLKSSTGSSRNTAAFVLMSFLR